MKYNEYDTDDMIAALATPWGESALAVIRTSGDGCIDTISPFFRGRETLASAGGYTMHYGKLVDPHTGNELDQIVAGVYRKPKSYTGQDMVEIFCHGSMPGITGILDGLRSTGFRDASPGEFTLRAFLNGKMDLTGAEAVNEIIKAKSPQAMSLALERLSGSVYNSINSIKTLVSGILAEIELQLDYAEDEADPEAVLSIGKIETAVLRLEKLSSTYRIGKVIQEGVKAVLTGRTNAGKSSLFNLLNRAERAIVSEYHGTTRDYIESLLVIGGIPVKLYDTAGIRVSDHPVESEGIKKSTEVIEVSDIIIYLVDGSDGVTDEDRIRLDYFDRKKLVKVWNKSDISTKEIPDGFIAVSSLTGSGLDKLEKEIAARIGAENITLDDKAVIDSQRQKKLIDDAHVSLENSLSAIRANMPLDVVAVDIRDALDSLGEITGEITTADILELMFSRFCVGK
ncbi:MAG: tRNA uridine-5-carboxymethylaminomethyl(34) synthesis GTPase MnmE [Spirochaetia bacterium]|jgi:tRNA modification GTPase|nr:tRNA uridine-5-carboxymethylaminomethyl(34) synthesis GTPase MnmE [Spirochaetia bacterium]